MTERSDSRERRAARAREHNGQINSLFDEPNLKPSEALMMLSVLHLCRDKGCCWASLACLARRGKVSVRQAKRIISKLEREGLLAITRRPYRRSIYRVLLPSASAVTGDTGGPLTNQAKGAICKTSRGTSQTAKGATATAHRTLNSNYEPKGPTRVGAGAREETATDPAPDGATLGMVETKAGPSPTATAPDSRTADMPTDSKPLSLNEAPAALTAIPANADLRDLRDHIKQTDAKLPDAPYGDLIAFARCWQEAQEADYSGNAKRDLATLKAARESLTNPSTLRDLIPLFFDVADTFERGRGLLVEDFARAIPGLVAEAANRLRKPSSDDGRSTLTRPEPGVMRFAAPSAPEGAGGDLWSRVLSRLRETMEPSTYADWLRPTRGLGVEDGVLSVETLSEHFSDETVSMFGDSIGEAIAEELGARKAAVE